MMEHVRLAVLKLLLDLPTYSANDSVLTTAIGAIGLICTRDQMRGQLTWLEEMRLVALTRPIDGVIVATLSERGADVAHGRATVPGIQRPSPRG